MEPALHEWPTEYVLFQHGERNIASSLNLFQPPLKIQTKLEMLIHCFFFKLLLILNKETQTSNKHVTPPSCKTRPVRTSILYTPNQQTKLILNRIITDYDRGTLIWINAELKRETLVDGFDERLDVSFLAENEGRREIRGGTIDGNSSGVVASVLQSPETIEKHLKDITPLSVNIVVQVRKYPTHCSSSSSSSSSNLRQGR